MKWEKLNFSIWLKNKKVLTKIGEYDKAMGYMILATAGAIIASSVFCLVVYWESFKNAS